MSENLSPEQMTADDACIALARSAGYVLPTERSNALQRFIESQSRRIAELEHENRLLRVGLHDDQQPSVPPTTDRMQNAERLIDATARHLESNWRAIDGFFLFKLLEFLGKPADYALGGRPAVETTTANKGEDRG